MTNQTVAQTVAQTAVSASELEATMRICYNMSAVDGTPLDDMISALEDGEALKYFGLEDDDEHDIETAHDALMTLREAGIETFSELKQAPDQYHTAQAEFFETMRPIVAEVKAPTHEEAFRFAMCYAAGEAFELYYQYASTINRAIPGQALETINGYASRATLNTDKKYQSISFTVIRAALIEHDEMRQMM